MRSSPGPRRLKAGILASKLALESETDACKAGLKAEPGRESAGGAAELDSIAAEMIESEVDMKGMNADPDASIGPAMASNPGSNIDPDASISEASIPPGPAGAEDANPGASDMTVSADAGMTDIAVDEGTTDNGAGTRLDELSLCAEPMLKRD